MPKLAEEEPLAKNSELHARIEDVTRQVKEDYETALKSVEQLKSKMNELERRISRKKTEEDVDSLTRAMESLDRLTDSQILKSREAWKKFEELTHDCRLQTHEPPELDQLRILCEKTEHLAADLLCYSLGRVEQKTLEQS